MIQYVPGILDTPAVLNVTSAWSPLAGMIKDVLNRFNIRRNIALELGVERGFSAVVLANYFKKVIGVDKWDWIIDDGIDRTFKVVASQLVGYPNISLVQSSFEDYIKNNNGKYDLVHVDIGYDTHAYDTTYPAGDWACRHSNCVLFHDTISFPGVNQACEELASKYKFEYYNHAEEIGPAGVVCGLGILIKAK